VEEEARTGISFALNRRRKSINSVDWQWFLVLPVVELGKNVK